MNDLDLDATAVVVFDLCQQMAGDHLSFPCSTSRSQVLRDEYTKACAQPLMGVFLLDVPLAPETRKHVCRHYVNRQNMDWTGGVLLMEFLLKQSDLMECVRKRLDEMGELHTSQLLEQMRQHDSQNAQQLLTTLASVEAMDGADLMGQVYLSDQQKVLSLAQSIVAHRSDYYLFSKTTRSEVSLGAFSRTLAPDHQKALGKLLDVPSTDNIGQHHEYHALLIETVNTIHNHQGRLEMLLDDIVERDNAKSWARVLTSYRHISSSNLMDLMGEGMVHEYDRHAQNLRTALFEGGDCVMAAMMRRWGRAHAAVVAKHVYGQLNNLVQCTEQSLAVDADAGAEEWLDVEGAVAIAPLDVGRLNQHRQTEDHLSANAEQQPFAMPYGPVMR